MNKDVPEFDAYFAHLRQISTLGRLYKRYVTSPILYTHARRFGQRVMEVGCGTGSGVLGAFPQRVSGLEINPAAVDYSLKRGLDVQLIPEEGTFPVVDCAFDACILDNVLEHIEHPRRTLDECHRITSPTGGLVIAVPGLKGFATDSDHKKFYEAKHLAALDARWNLVSLFSTPLGFSSAYLSRSMRQYCLVAIYQKLQPGLM